jgi:catalase
LEVPDLADRSSFRYRIPSLRDRITLCRLGLIGGVVIGVIALFAWAAGWFSPRELTQTRLIDRFQTVNGVHPGFRRNHAKGVCFTGWFDSNGRGTQLSRAAVFATGRTPVFGRFSLAGGMPRAVDKPASVRAMAVNFQLADDEVWRTAMIDIPVFSVKDAQGFYDQLLATRPDPNTGKPDPAKVRVFLATHPDSRRAAAIIKAHPFPSGFANTDFHALNAFLFVNGAGHSTAVRWLMVPEDAFQSKPAEKSADPDYLFDVLSTRLRQGPVRWHLVVTVAEPGDPTDNATLPWPANRRKIDVGTLTVRALQTEAAGNCRDINFDPLALPDGIRPSDDPLLSARSAAYSQSFARRAGEPKSSSMVQVGKGS